MLRSHRHQSYYFTICVFQWKALRSANIVYLRESSLVLAGQRVLHNQQRRVLPTKSDMCLLRIFWLPFLFSFQRPGDTIPSSSREILQHFLCQRSIMGFVSRLPMYCKTSPNDVSDTRPLEFKWCGDEVGRWMHSWCNVIELHTIKWKDVHLG